MKQMQTKSLRLCQMFVIAKKKSRTWEENHRLELGVENVW